MNGNDLVYLDNAATTLTPQSVIDAVTRFYEEFNANVHRGIHTLSEEATTRFEESRGTIAAFFNADPEQIVFTSGTTDSINTVANGLQPHITAEDNIVVSTLEHHSNLVPWQELCHRTGAELRFLPITANGQIDVAAADRIIDDDTAVVAASHVSNVFGTVNPVTELGTRAHDHGAYMLVDAAQSTPHTPIDVTEMEADFVVCSSHKMLGPTGVGVLYGRDEALNDVAPFRYGGSMIHSVEKQSATYADLPQKFEGGTPNIAGVIGFAAAVSYLDDVGMEHVESHAREHAAEIVSMLRNRFNEDVTVYGGEADRLGIVSFTLDQVHPHDLASLLDMQGVAIRAGHHCTQPLHEELGVPATARAATHLYNTADDVHRFGDAVEEAVQVFTDQ